MVARLRDAAFFWREDRKRPLGDRVADLAGVTFHQGLGSYLDKAEAPGALVDAMGATLATARADPIARPRAQAARLCQGRPHHPMVREFPELQGVMGGIYLEARATLRPRWPRPCAGTTTRSRSTPRRAPAGPARARRRFRVFAAVSLADKLDTLAGYFGLGLEPTGSSDPFGLRRAGAGRDPGAPRLLARPGAGAAGLRRWSSPLAVRATACGSQASRRDKVAGDLRGLPARSAAIRARGARLPGRRGRGRGPHAARPDALDDVRDCFARLEALHAVRAQAREDFEHLAGPSSAPRTSSPRTRGPRRIEPALFEHDAERELHAAARAADRERRRLRRPAPGARGPAAAGRIASSTTCS